MAKRAERPRSPEEEDMWSLLQEAKRHGVRIERVERHVEWAPCDFGGNETREPCAEDARWFLDGTPYCNKHTRYVLEIISRHDREKEQTEEERTRP